jgi:hypothetical protein
MPEDTANSAEPMVDSVQPARRRRTSPQFKARTESVLRAVLAKGVPEAELRAYLRCRGEHLTTLEMKRTRRVLRLLEKGLPWAQIKVEPSARPSQHNPEEHPRDSRFHDILLVRRTIDDDDDESTPLPKRHRFDRFRVIKEGPGRGGFQGPNGELLKEVGIEEDGYRGVINLATTAPGTPEERGPVFSALPLNPDPAASSSCTCYLVNPGNLNYVTAWTAEEWSDRPGDEGPPLDTGEDTFSMLIATPGGEVYYLEKKSKQPLEKPIEKDGVIFRRVDMKQEVEIWSQLRNGCVVGRAMYTQSPHSDSRKKVTPLVNIHSLLPATQSDDQGRGSRHAL